MDEIFQVWVRDEISNLQAVFAINELGLRAAFLSRGYSSQKIKGSFTYRTPHFVVTVHLVLPPFTFFTANCPRRKEGR